MIRGDTKEFQMWPAVYHIWSCGIDDHIWHRLLHTKAPGESQVWVKLTLKEILILPQISLKSFFSIKVAGKKSSLHLKSFTSGLWECPVSLWMLLTVFGGSDVSSTEFGGRFCDRWCSFVFVSGAGRWAWTCTRPQPRTPSHSSSGSRWLWASISRFAFHRLSSQKRLLTPRQKHTEDR